MLRGASSRVWAGGEKDNGFAGGARFCRPGRADDRISVASAGKMGSDWPAEIGRRLDTVGRQISGAAVRSARLRVGTVSLAHVAEAELAVLTPPGEW